MFPFFWALRCSWLTKKRFWWCQGLFPNLKDGQLSDRGFMWDILHTLKPMKTKNLINKAQENRGLTNEVLTKIIW